ncbi:hypothetical protein JVT61DRAFT_2585 [Boletus reticuloceps]|uniref:Uncharacterized protein n=1 Tax=Boletus reticuloceps TaxID=495285 RepID=A0A8I2YN64_9AGAM|nr:hypothetical protein JVT61DRAFT_2585 [Boletus reticuloceps]
MDAKLVEQVRHETRLFKQPYYMVSWDGPFARKLETMLGSFGHRTRAVGMWGLRDARITNYFSRE